MAKDTDFYTKTSLNCRGKLLFLDEPAVMGILNLTPDSFYDGGKFNTTASALKHMAGMIREGASIIDIGACSSRPGAQPVSEHIELKRLLPVIAEARKRFPEIIISVDTFRSAVARQAVEYGADMINDISAGSMDQSMTETIAELNVPYVLMHMQGRPADMQRHPVYLDVIGEVMRFFSARIQHLRNCGIKDVIIDPGFGFGKSLRHNYQLLEHLDSFQLFGLPVMVGISRKSMIWKPLQTDPFHALNGTIAAHALALSKGAAILRAHDVKQAREAIRIVSLMKNS